MSRLPPWNTVHLLLFLSFRKETPSVLPHFVQRFSRWKIQKCRIESFASSLLHPGKMLNVVSFRSRVSSNFHLYFGCLCAIEYEVTSGRLPWNGEHIRECRGSCEPTCDRPTMIHRNIPNNQWGCGKHRAPGSRSSNRLSWQDSELGQPSVVLCAGSQRRVANGNAVDGWHDRSPFVESFESLCVSGVCCYL